MPNKFVVCFLGPPGSGKGTAAQKLCQKANYAHFSAGDIFRKEIKSNTELGKMLKDLVEQGKLVPDDIIMKVISNFIEKNENPGYVIDAMPRTIGQAVGLESMLKEHGLRVDAVINFIVDEETIVSRLGGRLIHLPSGRVYHSVNSPPKVPFRDDITGEELVKREDDNESVIRTRIEIYHKVSTPILDFYEKQQIVHNLDGKMSIDEVLASIEGIISLKKTESGKS